MCTTTPSSSIKNKETEQGIIIFCLILTFPRQKTKECTTQCFGRYWRSPHVVMRTSKPSPVLPLINTPSELSNTKHVYCFSSSSLSYHQGRKQSELTVKGTMELSNCYIPKAKDGHVRLIRVFSLRNKNYNSKPSPTLPLTPISIQHTNLCHTFLKKYQ